jgi:ubiquinone/menaquinone biosynthesis C-methylase UbiE
MSEKKPINWNNNLPAFYSGWATEYAKTFRGELDYKPRDRELLQQFAKQIEHKKICDIGCGPGHIGGFLESMGLDVEGFDLSEGMIELAKSFYPSIEFQVGNFLELPKPAEYYTGLVAFYSWIHCHRDQLPVALKEANRLLKPGGLILASFHEGTEPIVKQDVVFNFYTQDEIKAAALFGGLELLSLESRSSYAEENSEWNRLYVLLAKPVGGVDEPVHIY